MVQIAPAGGSIGSRTGLWIQRASGARRDQEVPYVFCRWGSKVRRCVRAATDGAWMWMWRGRSQVVVSIRNDWLRRMLDDGFEGEVRRVVGR